MAQEEYPAELQYSSLEWSATMDLAPGTILRLSHESTNMVSYFECTGMMGGKVTEGVLSTLVNGEPTEVAKATINTLHTKTYMAQHNMTYVEFIISEAGRETRIHPAFTKIEKAFDSRLAQEVIGAERNRIEREPFQSDGSQTVLAHAVSLFLVLATREADQEAAAAYTTSAAVITKELLLS